MKKVIIAAAIALTTGLGGINAVSASTFPLDVELEANPNILLNMSAVKAYDQTVCYSCISPNTGRPRTNYVRPYTRRNGTYVNGYWRS